MKMNNCHIFSMHKFHEHSLSKETQCPQQACGCIHLKAQNWQNTPVSFWGGEKMQLERGFEDNSDVLFHNNEDECSSFHFII